MGWKVSAVIINSDVDISSEEILKRLGFPNFKKIEDETFDAAIYPQANKIYFGKYRDNLIITNDELPQKFITDTLSEEEKLFIELFPESEICAVLLHSAVNLWGYSIIKNGRKVRSRAGSADDGTFLEFGEPIEQEQKLLAQSELNSEGRRIYFLEDFPDEALSEDQVGEEFVFAILKRHTGIDFEFDDELFEINLNGYSYDDNPLNDNNLAPVPAKPWWNFWS
jgi:hypothetical protein